MENRFLLGAAIIGALALPATANAAIVVLDFEGVGNLNAVGNFYNGGGGTDYDIEFSNATLGVVDADAGGSGNFANEPSPDTVMFFLDASNATLNVLNGFNTGFSFFYTSATDASVTVWSGLDATGDLLGTLDLSAQFAAGCVGDPGGNFCNWTAVGVLFSGTAFSIDFGGTANRTAFDDITFGTDIPGGEVPEPAMLGLFGLGLAGLGLARRRSARKA